MTIRKAWSYNRQQGKEEWLTPPSLIKALGPFDLDPCSPVNRPWPTAITHFTIEEDGLLQDWCGRVWLNPPYGNKTHLWLRRMAQHNNGIALIFARTETAMWFDYIWYKAAAILFVKGRITFYRVDGKPGTWTGGAPSALIAYGQNNVDPLRNCGIAGRFILL